METLKIKSRMEHFRMVSRIFEVTPNGIDAEVVFDGDPCYVGLEAIAQTAALHVRHSLRFECHAFLLSVHHFRIPQTDVLKGRFRLAAELRGRSSEAYAYHVTARSPGGVDFDGELLIGTRAYDDRFKKEALTAHYRMVWDRMREA